MVSQHQPESPPTARSGSRTHLCCKRLPEASYRWGKPSWPTRLSSCSSMAADDASYATAAVWSNGQLALMPTIHRLAVAKTHKAWLQPASTGAMRSCPTCGLIRTAIMTSCSVSSWSMVFAIAASFTCLTATSDRLTRKCRPRWLYNRSIYAYACSLAVVSLQLCRISLSASPRSRSWNSLPLSPTAGHHPGGRYRRTV